MQRVLVIGCARAGKTHLARALAARSGLPLVHLDAHFWRPGWVEPAKADWQAQLAALLAEPHAAYRGRTRLDIGVGCVERFDWDFLRYVLSYRRHHRPRALAKLEGFSGELVILASPRQTRRWLAGLALATAAA